MSLQTRKTSVHLQKTLLDIPDEIRELSDPPQTDSKDITTIKAQKPSEGIAETVHVTGLQP